MKNNLKIRRSRITVRVQQLGVKAGRVRSLGVMAGIGSLLDLGGTGFSFRSSKRIPGFEADVQNIRGDFDAAVKKTLPSVGLTESQTLIQG